MSKHKLEYKDFVDATDDLVAPSFGYWFAGFTDGEGCFQIHQKNAPNPSWCCTFAIALRADDIDVLEGIGRWLTIGSLIPRRDLETRTQVSSSMSVISMVVNCLWIFSPASHCRLRSKMILRYGRRQYNSGLMGLLLRSIGQKHTAPEQLEIYHISMIGFRNDLRKGREYREPS